MEKTTHKRAVVFLAEGFEDVEAFTAIDYLRRARLDVQTVLVPTGLTSKSGGGKLPGKESLMVCSSHGIPVMADTSLEKLSAECKNMLPDAVYAPGGMKGSQNLANTPEVLAIIKKCFDAGKIVCAICAAPALVLSKTGVLAGKKWTCYPEMEEDADKNGIKGSEHLDGVPFVTDGNVVTGRGAGCAEQLAMELVRLLAGESEASRVHDATIQRDKNGRVR